MGQSGFSELKAFVESVIQGDGDASMSKTAIEIYKKLREFDY